MFRQAYASKLALLKNNRVTTTSLWDFIGLGEVRSRLGGKVKLIVTTSKFTYSFPKIVFPNFCQWTRD